MFGVGFLEICVIALFALIFIGPQKLPDFMRQLGQFMVQARRMSNEVKSSIEAALQETDIPSSKKEDKPIAQKPLTDTPAPAESSLAAVVKASPLAKEAHAFDKAMQHLEEG
jgi:Tat protein translocase TatB subunit